MKQIIIACTGGIGSGKSNVVKAFSALGNPCYDGDSRARALYGESKELLNKVVEIAGEDVLVDGVLDKRRLATVVFNDKKALESLEAVLYPMLIDDFHTWMKASKSKIVIFESAIILEKELFKGFADYILVVTAPLEERIERTMQRDGATRDQVLDRMRNQWPQERMEAEADYIIKTDDRTPILPKIIEIINQFENS